MVTVYCVRFEGECILLDTGYLMLAAAEYWIRKL